MTPVPLTVGADRSLADAHQLMRIHGVRHLPVVRKGELVGVISQRDIYLVESLPGTNAEVDRVVEAMTRDVYTVGPTASLRDVARTMADAKYGCAIVVEAGGVLGIFTSTDAFRHIAEALPWGEQ